MRARRRFSGPSMHAHACIHPPQNILRSTSTRCGDPNLHWYMTPSLPSLLLLLLPAAVASRCDPRETECSSLLNKVPAVTDHVMPMDSQPAATGEPLSEQRRRFEHMLGNSQRDRQWLGQLASSFGGSMHSLLAAPNSTAPLPTTLSPPRSSPPSATRATQAGALTARGQASARIGQHPGDVGAHVRADEDKLFH